VGCYEAREFDDDDDDVGREVSEDGGAGRKNATAMQQRLEEDPPEGQRIAAPILPPGPRSPLGEALAPPGASLLAQHPLLCKALPLPQDQ
jgi:hypothetical protein